MTAGGRRSDDRMVALREGVADMGGPLFAVCSPLLGEPTVSGWGRRYGDGTGSITIQQAALSGWDGGEVETETSLDEWSDRPNIVVRQLLGSDRTRPLDFPFSSTVTRETVTMRVAGRRRRVGLYRCSVRWIVPVRVGGRHITVTGRTVDPATVELVHLTDDDVEAALAAAQTRHEEFAAVRQAEQAAGRSTDRRVVDPRGRNREAVSEIGGPVFAAVGADLDPPTFKGGGTSGAGKIMKLESRGGERGVVRVTTMTGRPPFEDDQIVDRMIASDVVEPLRFPVTSTVHQRKLPLRLAGRRRPMTIFLCGPAWLARTRTAGHWLWIEGWAVDPRAVAIVPLSEADVAAAVGRSEEAMRRARAGQQ